MIYIYISAELTEYSPIINQIVVTHQAEKIWMYDCMTVQLTVQDATFNMHGQLCWGHTNATAFSSSLVVSALSSKLDNWVLVLAGARRYALKTCGEKKCELCF